MLSQNRQQRKPSSILGPVRSWLRHDYFISYSRNDGATYAVALRKALWLKGVRCKIDTRDFYPGQGIDAAMQKNVRRCAALIVVATPKALGSSYVAEEVELASELKRPVVPICIAGALITAEPSAVVDLLKTFIWLDETDQERPSPKVVQEIERSLRFVRFRTRLALAISCGFLITAITGLAAAVALAQPTVVRLRSNPNPVLSDYLDLQRLVVAATSERGDVLVGTYDGVVKQIDPSGSPHDLVGLKGYISGLVFPPQAGLAIGASVDAERILCWNLATRSIAWSLGAPGSGGFRAISECWNGTFYASDAKAHLWKVSASGRLISKVEIPGADYVESIDNDGSAQGPLLCLRDDGPMFANGRLEQKSIKSTLPDPESTFSGACRVGEDYVAMIVEEHGQSARVVDTRSLYVYDLRTRRSRKLESSFELYSRVIAIPGSDLFLSHSKSGEVAVWNAATGRQRLRFAPHPFPYQKSLAIGFAPGQSVIVVGCGQTVELWRLEWRTLFGIDVPFAKTWPG